MHRNSFESLKTHLERYGPEGVLEVAENSKNLTEGERERLRKLVKEASTRKKKR